jgi:hypothetical protein
MSVLGKSLRHVGVKVVAMHGVTGVGSALAIFGDHGSAGRTSPKTLMAPATPGVATGVTRAVKRRDRNWDGRGMSNGTRAPSARHKGTHPGSAGAPTPRVGFHMSRTVLAPQLRACGADFGVLTQRKRDGQILPQRGVGMT